MNSGIFASLVFAPCLLLAAARAADPMPAFKPGNKILFQGDSITDGNRGRGDDPNHILGHGYQFIISSFHGAAYPERKLEFMNCGISGNKLSDLVGRWQQDTLNLKPDIVSILVGINDTGANVPIDDYERDYDKLLADTVAALPGVRLVLCEPFSLPVGKYKENSGPWMKDVAKRGAVVARLAKKYKAPFVRFQQAFDDACKRAPAEYWIWDGVHPTYSGHQIMAEEWVRTVRKFYP